jgi:hypothetical protein
MHSGLNQITVGRVLIQDGNVWHLPEIIGLAWFATKGN